MSKNKKLTIPDAVLKCLEDKNKTLGYMEIYNYIKENNLCNFENAKTPQNSVARVLSSFVIKGDIRVKRHKDKNGTYLYYLANKEKLINFGNIENDFNNQIKPLNKIKTFEEKDLHILLSTYLNKKNIFSKTISHQKSNNNAKNQIWTHPDIVGIKFLELENDVSKTFIKTTNKIETFKLYSYEIKKEINNDNELKQAYFQAVSNSSWANYGYLVAFEYSDNLKDEIERLNQSFGIGIIQLNANPFESKLLYQAQYKELDFKTFDKLCSNKDFKGFIEISEKLISAEEKHFPNTKRELIEFCDTIFANEEVRLKHCKEHNIPIKYEQDELF